MKNFSKRAFLHFLPCSQTSSLHHKTQLRLKQILSKHFFASTQMRQHSHLVRTTSSCLQTSLGYIWISIGKLSQPLKLEPSPIHSSSSLSSTTTTCLLYQRKVEHFSLHPITASAWAFSVAAPLPSLHPSLLQAATSTLPQNQQR